MANIFYVGIDLGTSRSSIATSTGKRISAITCVGYPKDVISRKRVGKDYLFGEEALENRLSLNMVWPLADGVIREDEESLEATRLVLKHIIAEAISEKQESDKVYVAIGVPAQANINNKKAIIEAAKGFVDKLLIVSEAFTVAYSIDRFDECLIVDIGAGTTDLCRMHGSIPEDDDQITLNIAGNFLDRELTKAILESFPDVQLSPQIIKRIKEKHGYVSDVSEPVKVTLNKRGIPAEYDITEILRECCLKLTNPISKAIQDMVGTFDPDFQEKLRNNVILAGGGSRLKGIDLAVEKSLLEYGKGDADCVNDAEYCGSVGALKMCIEMPEEYWEKI
ncbi:rod shape-determining protein [Candidatus Parabeggiatoa sp. HSG14]|uniref:rod shape-determining protein n=1 Tax=Candidatus Parabeggiatoa sp. HSG14 TaxID=3055593 RepID=UPI0025A8FFB2|nr:rod shape-determining protein [Thiotrichales bacterium HSG14]